LSYRSGYSPKPRDVDELPAVAAQFHTYANLLYSSLTCWCKVRATDGGLVYSAHTTILTNRGNSVLPYQWANKAGEQDSRPSLFATISWRLQISDYRHQSLVFAQDIRAAIFQKAKYQIARGDQSALFPYLVVGQRYPHFGGASH